MSEENLLQVFAGATSELAGQFQKIKGGPIVDGSYADNIALLATYSGSDTPVVVVVENVLVGESAELSTEDGNEVAAEVTFAGHYDPADLDTEPWAIYHPGEDAVA